MKSEQLREFVGRECTVLAAGMPMRGVLREGRAGLFAVEMGAGVDPQTREVLPARQNYFDPETASLISVANDHHEIM